MRNLNKMGEALLMVGEGQRDIAQALAGALRRGGRRLGRRLFRKFSQA